MVQVQRAQSLDVPHVKKLVRDGAESSLVNAWITKRAGLNDLSRSQMLHAVAGTIVGRVVDQNVYSSNSGGPHIATWARTIFSMSLTSGASSTFWSKRVDHDVILFPINFEVVLGPIGSDFGRCVDHDVPVWKPPFGLTGSIGWPLTIRQPPGAWILSFTDPVYGSRRA